jgi:hypothetical protein
LDHQGYSATRFTQSITGIALPDRELFLFAKRAVPPAEMKELQKEAAEERKDVDVLVLLRVFGAERIRKYEQLLEKRSVGF